jgi:hypothetical protein
VSFADALFMKDHQLDRYSLGIDQILDIYRRFDETQQGVKSQPKSDGAPETKGYARS